MNDKEKNLKAARKKEYFKKKAIKLTEDSQWKQ